MQRLGIFGGSFDPIHTGHLILAELCSEALELDRVKFVVANRSPLKTGQKSAGNKDRIEMTKLAIGGNSRFELDSREIERGGVSFTLDTVKSIAAENPGVELYLLMGADILLDIHRWRNPVELFQICSPAVIARGGIGEPNLQLLAPYVDHEHFVKIIERRIQVPQIEISSSNLKDRIRQGQSIRYQVPASVEAYISEHALYRTE